MYSFFPCLPADRASVGFARPTISLPGLITPRLTQGKKMSRIADGERARELWAQIAGQVDEKLCRGVHAELPHRGGAPPAAEATRKRRVGEGGLEPTTSRM